jgi:6-phosphofructokinase 1
MLGVRRGVPGLVEGRIQGLDWMRVNGMASRGGADLGTSRHEPCGGDFYAIAKNLEEHRIDGLLLIGGWTAYQTAYALFEKRDAFPAFDLPIVCMPAAITNNLPGSENSVGADTALNSIVWAVDAIKQSAVASNRAFVVEVMGYFCGYLALMGGLATGAERVYLHEEGVTLADLERDVCHLRTGFERGKRLGLVIRNEKANPVYDTDFMCALFEEEGGDLFEVRKSILGHLQQGGDPSPLDRILAARLATHAVDILEARGLGGDTSGALVGVRRGHVEDCALRDFPRLSDEAHHRPAEQWWMSLRPIARLLAQPGPGSRPFGPDGG